ncbi:MAG: agmatinase [Chloroflexota bacterium]
MSTTPGQPVGPVDGMQVPRFAGFTTFARLPRLEDASECAVAVVGVPFDAGTTYRPGARFGPNAIRQGSRLLRPYHPGLDVRPFAVHQVADAGDIVGNPFNIDEAIAQIEAGARHLLSRCQAIVALGGDHTIALPLLRAVHARHGPVSLVHFDAHLDTWDTYWGAAYTHGTPFRRASEEGLLRKEHCVHVGIRGPLYGPQDLDDDAQLGFTIIDVMEVAEQGVRPTIERIRAAVGNAPVYISIDIDVLDPGFAPGTGTPEAGGLSSRELLGILRGFTEMNVVSADIVEVAPAYDHAEITSIAAAHLAYELLALLAKAAAARR